MITTLSGANDHLRGRELHAIMQAFEGEYGAMAIERFDGEEASSDRMREALMSMPFLSPRKLVVLREAGKQKAFAELIADTLKNIADTTDVVFYEPKLDKRSSYYKTLKKETDYKELGELDAFGLAKWATEYVKIQGGELPSQDARFLLDRTGPSQQLL